MPKVLPEAGEYAPLWSGLFRPLRSPVHEGALVWSEVFLETEDQEEKYLVDVSLGMKEASVWFLVFAQLYRRNLHLNEVSVLWTMCS